MTAPDPQAIARALDAAEQTAKAGQAELTRTHNGPLSGPIAFVEWWPEQQACVSRFADPAAVLRHVAAARQILDSAVETLNEHHEIEGFRVCARCVDYDGGTQDMAWPCPDRRRAVATLTALATAWQPDKQETT